MAKKLLSIILCLSMVLSFGACQKNNTQKDGEESTLSKTETTDTPVNLPPAPSDPAVKIYVCHDSPEKIISPQVTLYGADSIFRFSYSMFSSEILMGTYEMTDTELILTADSEPPKVYTFKISDADTLIFDSVNSSTIPSYKYGESEEPLCPVSDGAVFLDDTENMLNDWVSAVPVISAVLHDLNGDGSPEECALTHGPTSGINSFALHVADKENEKEYSECWGSDIENARLIVGNDGGLYISGDERLSLIDYVAEYETVTMKISIENEELKIEKAATDNPYSHYLAVYDPENRKAEASQEEINAVCEKLYEIEGRTDPYTGFDYYCVVNGSFEMNGEKFYLIYWNWLVEDENGEAHHASAITNLVLSEDHSKLYEAFPETDGTLKIYHKLNRVPAETTDAPAPDLTAPVFETEGIIRITLYGYYGTGSPANVPAEDMNEFISWLATFTIGDKYSTYPLPGTDTHCIEIEYEDGTIVKNGLDTIVISDTTYHLNCGMYPDSYWEIISGSNLEYEPVA